MKPVGKKKTKAHPTKALLKKLNLCPCAVYSISDKSVGVQTLVWTSKINLGLQAIENLNYPIYLSGIL